MVSRRTSGLSWFSIDSDPEADSDPDIGTALHRPAARGKPKLRIRAMADHLRTHGMPLL
jgi:hypothetical protein